MTYEQAKEAVKVGIDCVKELSEKGYKIIVTGEMGIGNTTTSSAVASVLLDRKAEDVTGRGAGLTNGAFERKIEVIKKGRLSFTNLIKTIFLTCFQRSAVMILPL